MKRDIRDTTAYRDAEGVYRSVYRPGTGLVSDAAEISAFETQAVFTGILADGLDGTPPTRICLANLKTGDTRLLTAGPNFDRSPKFAPSGKQIAFLSDRHRAGDFQLYLLDPVTGAATPTPKVDGWVEYLHWSPDETRILLGVAGHGADVAGAQGAVTSEAVSDAVPAWMPDVKTGHESHHWRSAWVYELACHRVRQVSLPGMNVWETVWSGNESLAAIASSGPGEGLWYSACLHIVDVQTGRAHQVYEPRDQIGWPAASPSGEHLAVVEAVCSDRWIVAGELRVIETTSGQILRIDTQGVDITYTEWRSGQKLLLAGHRKSQTVVCMYDAALNKFSEVWSSEDISVGGWYITVSGLNETGDCALLGEGFRRAPEIAVIRQGKYIELKSFDSGYSQLTRVIESAQHVVWNSRDGLEIHGWLLRPKGKGPHPLIMDVHGGPVLQWRPRWLGRGGIPTLMLLERGYAIFYPNPRGSSGRGLDFARRVLGDMGGADTYDYLSGLDYLVDEGIADPKRIGVTGGSYGGFMTSWLITQDSRFAAAVSLAPMTNQVTAHLISNIPHFVSLFLDDAYNIPGGKYFTRSPIMYAHQAKTPTLNVCGELDRCTPAEEAMQFHNALLENGVESVLVTYPQEGHGVHKLPAVIDFSARVVSWFEMHMPP